MILKYAEILNFDSIIRDEWVERARHLHGPNGSIGIASPMIRPYLEQGAKRSLVSLLAAMRTIRDCLPEDKRKDFESRCLLETHVQYGTKYHLLKEVCDSVDSTKCAM